MWHFPITPEGTVRPDERGNQHIMSVTASDRPRPALRHRPHPQPARHQHPLGERVEDTFLISGQELGKMVILVHLEQELLEALQI